MTEGQIRIDYALAMAQGVGEAGITDARLDAAGEGFAAQLSAVMKRVDDGELGFWRLPGGVESAEAAVKLAASLDHARDVLVLGIGGSSLGARAVNYALSGARAAAGFPEEGRRRVHFPDNSDPWLLGALLETLDPRQTAALVVSKSGGTVETAAQLLIVRKWLTDALGEAALPRHLVAITDPEKGTLRALANELSLSTLPIPSNVGGRFSVLTACGLLPAALAGIDVKALLAGAAAMAKRCENPKLRENPAGLIATLSILHTQELGHGIHVLMPYADALRPVALWFVQLWAESLGKRRDRQGNVVEVGPTPVPAVGATDQHAQVQLFVEGPRDKLVTFLAVDSIERDLTMPEGSGDLAYLSGRSLGELLDAERRGTALALARAGRPSLALHLPALDAHSLGQLLFLYEAATALAGEQLDIDAFDQPGVEEGKRLAFGLLNRPGYEAQREEVLQHEKARSDAHRC